MRKVIIVFIILIAACSAFCQQTNPVPTLTKQDYLEKSKNQKKISQWVGIPGSAMFLAGSVLYFSEILDFSPASPYNERKANAGEALMITGGAAVLVSAGFAIASRSNKKKAMSLALNKQFVPQLQESTIVYHPIPSLTLKISL